MKAPEEYFNVRKIQGGVIYEWRDTSGLIMTFFFGALIVVTGFIKTFVENRIPPRYFFIVLILFVFIFFIVWIKGRSKLTITVDDVTIAKGFHLFFGNSGIKYSRNDIQHCYIKSSSFVSDLDFISSSNLLFLLLKDGTSVKLHNGLAEEYEQYMLSAMKSFFPYGEKPSQKPLTNSMKIILAIPIIVFFGVITPGMLESGEYEIEKQSNAMRFASGLLMMGFMYWIITGTNIIFKPGELGGGGKMLVFLISFFIGTAILYYWHLA